MQQNKFWLRTLNVDQGEWWIVKKLIFLQFLQGAGIAFFFTASFTTFLIKFPITELPRVMIDSAILLWIAGFLYNKAEQKLSFNKLIIALTTLMAVSVLLFRIAAYNTNNEKFFYWMLAWFNALYLLNNLQFWGIATQVFDLRQSKRLFGLISSGDIPAKFIGYTMAVLVVPFTGAMNLLYLGAFCLIASLPFVLSIARSGQLLTTHNHKDHTEHHGSGKLGALLKNFTSNTFIRDIAFISFLAFMSIIIIDYGFYSEVKHEYKNDVSLAKFIAMIGLILRLAALLTKLIFTGRVTSTLGIKKALLITPITMIILISLIVVTKQLTTNEKIIFYLFGAASIIVDVFRTVFNAPTLLSAMQPLPTHDRLRAHNIVKGIMDPFAYLIAGLILMGLIRLEHHVNLLTICYVILTIGILWIPGIWLVNRQYLKILIHTISRRYFSQEEFSLNNDAILQLIRNKITTGTDLEVISILKMLNSKKDPIAEDLITQLLSHNSPQVKLETLRLVSGNNSELVKNRLEELIHGNESREIRQEAVRAMAKIGKTEWGLREFIESTDIGIQNAALSGLLLNTESHARNMAEEYITKMIHHGVKADKLQVSDILQEVRDEYYHPLLSQLLIDPDLQVQAHAIKAIGKATHADTLYAALTRITHHGKQVMIAFQNTGENSVSIIGRALEDGLYPEWHTKFILLIGRIGGEKAQDLLLKRLADSPEHLPAVIRSLYRTHYQADEETQKKMETLARLYIIYGVELLHMQKMVGPGKEYQLLEGSINLEIQEIREILLCLFGCMYNRIKMNQVRKGLESNLNEHIANAMEIIELTIKKDLGQYFNNMFETTSIEHRCDALRSLLKDLDFQNVDHILEHVLTEKPIQYQNWTKACSLYISKKLHHQLDPVLVKKYTRSENRLLRETAQYAE
jgi:ATP:ADP antiporter, AAA family